MGITLHIKGNRHQTVGALRGAEDDAPYGMRYNFWYHRQGKFTFKFQILAVAFLSIETEGAVSAWEAAPFLFYML